MSIETAVFAVQRGGKQYKCAGRELKAKTVPGDLFAVWRGYTPYKGTSDKVRDTDLLACTDTNGVTYKVTGEKFKSLFGGPWVGVDAVYHVITEDYDVIKPSNHTAIYNIANQDRVSSISAPGEWIITGKRTKFQNSKGNWIFGDQTEISNVTNMNRMFYNAQKFYQDINNWDVSNVMDMTQMFFNARAFNSDLTDWDVHNVTNMSFMFYNAHKFNQDISNWNVGNVTNMRAMFQNGKTFNIDISNWDVSKVRDMSSMFYDAEIFNTNISTKQVTVNGKTYTAWDVSNVTRIDYIFKNARAFNSDISDWDVGNITNMKGMFLNAQAFNSDISDWDVGNVTNMIGMFENASYFNQDLSNWCVTNITSEPDEFAYGTNAWTEPGPCWGHCPPKGDPCPAPWEGATGIYHVQINKPADIKVTNQYKIYNLVEQKEVSSISTSGEYIITGLNTQFKNSSGNWSFGNLTDTSNVMNMYHMFYNAKMFNSDISNWDVSNVRDTRFMFFDAITFESDISNWKVDRVNNMASMFNNAQAFNSDISKWNVGNVHDMRLMFHNSLVFNSDISNWNVSRVQSMYSMFNNTKAFKGDISNWKVGNVTNMSGMFNYAALFNSDIRHWDVGNVTNMRSMFQDGRSFNSDISQWDVSKVTNMRNMFYDAHIFNQDLSGWCVDPEPSHQYFDTGALGWTEPRPVWGTCPAPHPWKGAAGIYHVIITDPNGIRVTEHTNIYNLANQAKVSSITAAGEWIITGADTKFASSMSSWDFGKLTDTRLVTNMSNMFKYAQTFESDISNWNVGNVTDMCNMFRDAKRFNSDISQWDVSKVTCMGQMFSRALVFNQDLTSWCVDPAPTHVEFRTDSAMPSDGSHDPVWNTCPPRNP